MPAGPVLPLHPVWQAEALPGLSLQAVAAHEAPSVYAGLPLCYVSACLEAGMLCCCAASVSAHMQMRVLTGHALQRAACVAAGEGVAQPRRKRA